MRYLTVRPEMQSLDRYFVTEDAEEPVTERRPELTEAWAKAMNDVQEVCPACNR